MCLEDCTHGDPGVVFPSGGDAGSKGESSSAAAQRCTHSFHAQCLRVYVQHNIAAKAAPPYTCPEPACAFLLSEQNVAQLQLGDADLSRYNVRQFANFFCFCGSVSGRRPLAESAHLPPERSLTGRGRSAVINEPFRKANGRYRGVKAVRLV